MSWFDRLLVLGLPLVPRPVMKRLGRRYVAGEERTAALELGARLEAAGYRATYDVLGEAVARPDQVTAALSEYRALFADLRRRGLELNLSCKPTQMGLLIDQELCFRSVDELVRLAGAGGGFVRFEMEDSPTVDGTLGVFARLRREHGDRVGCVLQAMLRRSEADARALLAAGGPLSVRLVKGIYVEPEEVAFQDRQEIRNSFLALLERLLAGGARVGVATHDDFLYEGYLRLLTAHPEWRERSELQMLLGIRDDLRKRARAEGVPVRVYVPYGSHWVPYVKRRLAHNPRLARLALVGLFRRRERLGD
ncbi:MAG: L-proline dehydrogenase [Planctomycetota bacterium]|nr:MAG: L-proline dehydrogenase [Planctomycetota bacterium]